MKKVSVDVLRDLRGYKQERENIPIIRDTGAGEGQIINNKT